MATAYDAQDPLSCLDVRDVPEPEGRPGWVTMAVRAAAFNHHDLWTLRGMAGQHSAPPVILGTDAAGVTEDGRRVLAHAVVAPGRLLSEGSPGTLAEQVSVPEANLVPLPEDLSFTDAACLPTSYLTAYNLLFGKGRLRPGEHVLIQGAGGGVSTAAILLARAGGLEVTVTGRNVDRLRRAQALGAHHAVASGTRLPARVDAVLETVGQATWGHSLRSVRSGGRVVVAGATTGFDPPAELPQLFLRDVDVRGVFMGSAEQLRLLTSMLVATGVRPLVDVVVPLEKTHEAARRMWDGDVFGKVVVSVTDG